MICQEAQENFIPYLYRELDEKTYQSLLAHLEKCQACKRELADMRNVGEILSLSHPENWWKAKKKYVLPLRPFAWAAVLLLTFVSGGVLHSLLYPSVRQDQSKIVQLLIQSQKYRSSLSEDQKILVQTMEKELAALSGNLSLIEELHKIENSISKKLWKDALRQKQEFSMRYPDSQLNLSLNTHLFFSLVKAGEYSKAKGIYKNFLEQAFLMPEERGKALWYMSVCMEKTGEKEKCHALWEKLEANPACETYRAKAIRLLADKDFSECHFPSARMRYQKYLEENGQKDEQLEKYIEWINYHEKDAFYPLILFVQASQKGSEYYYGLKIILENYPESPLAITACEMYLHSQQLQMQGKAISFPGKKSIDNLISYLNLASESPEFQEISTFMLYWKASLLEQKGMKNLALKVYKKIQEENSYNRISHLATEAIYRIEQEQSYNKRREL